MSIRETGLVLSGGAIRGFAHLGALQALNEQGFYPDIISGASVGAIVGAFYADGYLPAEIYELFKKTKKFEIAELAMKRNGLLEINGIEKLLKKNLRARYIENLKIPLYITLTNLNTGKVEYVNTGNLIKSVIASSSIPVLFKPVKIESQWYVDGGVTDNFPVFPLIDKCKELIGVDVYPLGTTTELKGLVNMALRSFHIGVNANLRSKQKIMDIFIEPEGLKNIGALDFSKRQEMYRMGYDEAIIQIGHYKENQKSQLAKMR
jgi:NTE family protein